MPVIAREVMWYDESRILNEFNFMESIDVQFDDKTITIRKRALIVSWYLWGILRPYTHTPILSTHAVDNGPFTNDSLFALCGKMNASIFDNNSFVNVVKEQENVAKLIYESINALYNFITMHLGEYVSSINAVDMAEIYFHPKIVEANAAIMKDNERVFASDIAKTSSIITNVVRTAPEFKHNPMAKAIRQKLVKLDQFNQIIGPRGNVTDIDSNVFRRTIKTGFFAGMRNLEDIMKESRSAAKSLYFQTDPMKKSEYFNRVMQICMQTIRNLHAEDCGSTETMDFEVVPGNDGSLDYLIGVQYLKEGKFVRFNGDEKHLIGTIIQKRSIFRCHHPDKYGVCIGCFGDLGRSFPEGTNLGHFCATEGLLSELTQTVLSVKHLDSSIDTGSISVEGSDASHIAIGSDTNRIKFSPHMNLSNTTMLIPIECMQYISDVERVKNVNTLSISRITQIDRLTLHSKKGKFSTEKHLELVQSARVPSLTHEALSYIKSKGWKILEEGMVEIDMSGWNMEWDLLEYPLKHYNAVDFLKSLEHILKSSDRKEVGKFKNKAPKRLIEYPTADDAIAEIHKIISSRVYMHISHLEIILLASMGTAVDNGNFNPPLDRANGQFAKNKKLMTLRSLPAAMSFQGQVRTLTSIESHIFTDRPEHPMDPLWLY